MAKKDKQYRYEYSRKEMQEKCGFKSEDTFVANLDKVCLRYGLDKEDFKQLTVESEQTETTKYAAFRFQPEYADLLMLLVKNCNMNPYIRKNANLNNVKATSIAEYYKEIVKDSDTKIDSYHRELLYSRKAFLTAEQINLWMKPFLKEFFIYLMSTITMDKENVGAVLTEHTKVLSEKNYVVFRNNIFRKELYKELLKQNNDEKSRRNKIRDSLNINDHNKSIDNVIADLIKQKIKEAKKNSDEEAFFPFEEYYGECCNRMKDEELRHLYIEYYMDPDNDFMDWGNIENAIISMRKDRDEWKPVYDKINDMSYDEFVEWEENKQREFLQEQIRRNREMIRLAQKALNKLSNNKSKKNKSKMMDELRKEYIAYCDWLDKKYEGVYDKIDLFLGSVLNELLEINR